MLPASLCAKIMVFRRITRIIEVVLNERAVSETEKKSEIIWKVFIKTLIFAAFSEENTKKFGLWCNGSTTGFGSVCPGSNPGSPTTNQRKRGCLKMRRPFLCLQKKSGKS